VAPPESSRQATLDGVWIPAMPPVRRSDGHILEWDRERIVRQILVETRLVEIFYGGAGADEETARSVAREVEDRIRRLNLTSPALRSDKMLSDKAAHPPPSLPEPPGIPVTAKKTACSHNAGLPSKRGATSPTCPAFKRPSAPKRNSTR